METGGFREVVRAFLLEQLAEDEGKDVAQLRLELLLGGEDMPYDSVLLAELIGRVQRRFGVRLKPNLQTARDMRSVGSFAERVVLEHNNQAATEVVNMKPSAVGKEGEDDG